MYIVRHRFGTDSRALELAKFLDVIREVVTPDDEHPDVSLQHESGWCLSYFHGGRMVFENVEEGSDVWHVTHLDEYRACELWQHLADGDIDWVRSSEAWLPGYA